MAVRSPGVIAGLHNTRQARLLEGETTRSLTVEAVNGALADAGLTLADVDGIASAFDSAALAYDLGIAPCWTGSAFGLGAVEEAAAAIERGAADVIVVVSAQAGEYRDHGSTAPWTRPENEFVAPWGMFTAAEFALIARRHMEVYGTTRRQLSLVAATIRNNGSVNPDAVYHGKGPFTPEDIEASRPIADPFHLLDCSMTSEGGVALVLTRADRAPDLRVAPVHILGCGLDSYGPAYQYPPAWDLQGRREDTPAGYVGRRAARRAFAQAGVTHDDIGVLELYDPFSFEIIRQLEAFGFCGEGEGGAFVEEGHIAIDGSHPVTTDGGLMSYSHAGGNPQMLQRVVRAAQQVRGEAATLQVPDVEVALCSNGGAGALFSWVMLLGKEAA